MKIEINSLAYWAIGAFIYWVSWGNPDAANVIPFIAMLFFWPFYLIWVVGTFVAKWVAISLAVVVGGVIAFLIYEYIASKIKRRNFIRKMKGGV